MSIGYWINDEKWQLVEKEIYNKFNGRKCICPKGRSSVWFFVMRSLLQFR